MKGALFDEPVDILDVPGAVVLPSAVAASAHGDIDLLLRGRATQANRRRSAADGFQESSEHEPPSGRNLIQETRISWKRVKKRDRRIVACECERFRTKR
jgi:hypothetical protein